MIEVTDRGFINATEYTPYPMPSNSFTIQPSDNVIATSSEWAFTLNVPIPLA